MLLALRRTILPCLLPRLSAILLMGTSATMAAPAQAEESGGLQIYFIDVMGGAATLIVTPARETILVDTGWPGFEDRDPKRIEQVLKDVAGCDHLDHLVITHWHRDHFGGVEGLSKLVEIRNFWDRGLPDDKVEGLDFPDGPKPDDPLYLAYKKACEGKRHVLEPGQRFNLGHSASLTVLAAGGHVLDAKQRLGNKEVKENPRCAEAPPDLPEDRSDNARSVAFLLEYGDFQFFDAGDLTWNVEKQLVCPVDLIGPVDVYQVTHHGLDISNHPTLIQTVQPTVTIMNNGPRKGGTADTVKRLRTIPSIQAAYQLHRNAQTGPEDNTDPELIANTDEAGGEFIALTVEPGGTRYSVRIGADGKARAFGSR